MVNTDKQSNQNQESDEWAAGREERERRGDETLKYQQYLKQQIAASQQRQAEMSNANQLRQEQVAAKDKERQGTGGSETDAGSEPKSLRERWRAARRDMDLKQKAKDKIEEKVLAPIGKLKTKLLNLIPGYGPYVAFKQVILMKKGKFTLVDILIMLFSNLTACFMVLAVLAFIALIITWATDPLTAVKAIMNLSWGAISALVNLFKGLL